MMLMVDKCLVYRHFARVLGVTQECSISLTSKGSQVQSLSLPPLPTIIKNIQVLRCAPKIANTSIQYQIKNDAMAGNCHF